MPKMFIVMMMKKVKGILRGEGGGQEAWSRIDLRVRAFALHQ